MGHTYILLQNKQIILGTLTNTLLSMIQNLSVFFFCRVVPPDESIDLINVAFEQRPKNLATGQKHR